VTRWRPAWAGAQLTGVLFSTMVWIVVVAIPAPVALLFLGLGTALVLGRATRPGLWWRFGVRPATQFERGSMCAAIVPIASLRGRRQPAIWVGRRTGGRDVIMVTARDLVLSERFVTWVVNGKLSEDEVCALVSHALGRQAVDSSALVASLDAYCGPWLILAQISGGFAAVGSRIPLAPFAWKIRWVVFAVAVVDSYLNQRWAAMVLVAIIAVLSWSTGVFAARWSLALQRLGDERVLAEGFGPTLAAMLRRSSCDIAQQQRAEMLSQGRP
jgi:hypothetical protein